MWTCDRRMATPPPSPGPRTMAQSRWGCPDTVKTLLLSPGGSRLLHCVSETPAVLWETASLHLLLCIRVTVKPPFCQYFNIISSEAERRELYSEYHLGRQAWRLCKRGTKYCGWHREMPVGAARTLTCLDHWSPPGVLWVAPHVSHLWRLQGSLQSFRWRSEDWEWRVDGGQDLWGSQVSSQ